MKETYEFENWCRGNERDLGGNMILFKQFLGDPARAREGGGCGEAERAGVAREHQPLGMK